jgi:type III restriction enzyme
MKFTLKDYQSEAVRDVLDRLRKARKRWHEDGDKHAFSLTATTGAGKTVMAAAVFEALFYGDEEYDVEPDRGAVVIWFSDDPSLNEQSKFRLSEASDRLTVSQLRTVDSTFSSAKFDPGKIYFLNTQKLSKNSLLVRGGGGESEDEQQSLPMPDLRSHTIWDTIQNTIEDPDLTLYLVLDEAHRGMKNGTARTEGKQTIVKQLINGKGGVPGIPVVWGISATVQRFNSAVADMEGRSTLPHVVVDSRKVQESGLLKDTINLDVPDEVGEFATVLLRRGTGKLRELSNAWKDYAKAQHDADTVLPLMVLQVPNSPDHNEIGTWLRTVFDSFSDLPTDCIANVFGEHKTETFGGFSAPYIAPERVQESEWVRILVAKDAISTGWDCPRAEVMVSLRAATDETHITQLLGRMVRSPLARRIPGNDRLNSVDCLLPYFNKKSVQAVVNGLMTGGESGEELPGRRVLVNPREMKPNPEVPEEVWDKLVTLPTQALPKKQAKPVKRLTLLAHELAVDGLRPDAGKIAHAEMHKVLDGLRARYHDEIEQAREGVLTVEGQTVTTEVETGAMSFNDFVEIADTAVIEDAYKRAARIISADLARTYSEHLADRDTDSDDRVDALIEAHTAIAALGLVPGIKDHLDREAEKLSTKWLTEHRVDLKSLNDERQDVYREIAEMSAEPVDMPLARPRSELQASTAVRDVDGSETALPRFAKHLLCDEDGLFPACFNDWETTALKTELARNDCVAWYRNPGRGYESLGITYAADKSVKIMRPDFLVFARDQAGNIVVDIVDPHGIHLGDALSKLQGLAEYAERHAGSFRRVDAVAVLDGEYRVLDLTEKAVRDAVLAAASAKSLYESAAAQEYVVAKD